MPYSITVKKRTNEKLDELRKSGLIPGVVYGPDRKPVSIAVTASEFEKLYNEAGDSSLIDLMVEGEKEAAKALIQDIQYDPVKGKMIHCDLRQINMSEEMHASIEIVFVGEPPAVKELGGTLMKPHASIEVKCLPKDLIGELEVDLSILKTFDDAIHVGDLKLPAGMTALDQKDQLIAKVTPPLSEDELKAMEEVPVAATIEDIEVEKKGKKEEEGDGAEGAPAGEKKPEKKEEKK